jgi:multiple sugar transport system ATP-binding protein
MIAGLEEISRGSISIDGKVVNDVHPKDRDIAMVFQNYALYPHMNVRDNLAFGLKLRKFDQVEIDNRVTEAARILELEELLNRKPKALSGGQRQRVALGRAIVRKPKVFLFDEPLSNLDAKLRGQMRVEISRLHQQLETTMIYVTHDQVEAMTMGTRIVVMKDGIVNQIGTPLEIYYHPANQFVAGFIGSPIMNFIKGTVKAGGFNSGEIEYKLTEDQKENTSDGEVILGIRPEDLSTSDIREVGGHFQAIVELSEPMGAETHLHLNSNNFKLVAKVKPEDEYNFGESVTIQFSAQKTHLFDIESGKTIGRS